MPLGPFRIGIVRAGTPHNVQIVQKAGLPVDAWREPAARLQIFQAEVFGENR